jgi:hypothetical protein
MKDFEPKSVLWFSFLPLIVVQETLTYLLTQGYDQRDSNAITTFLLGRDLCSQAPKQQDLDEVLEMDRDIWHISTA